MKKCTVCGNEEYEGALYCSECGVRLERQDDFSQPGRKELKPGLGELDEGVIVAEIDNQQPESLIMCIKILESGKVFPLQSNTPMIFGRLVEDQPILPDVDLTGLSEYTNGVSRLHAEFCWLEDGVYISDLGSVNRTRVNGMLIQPNNRVRVKIGDIVELGKVKAVIIQC